MEKEFIDNAYKTGAGRYLQEPNSLDDLAEEALRFGKKPIILYGPNSKVVALDLAKDSLEARGVPFEEVEYTKPPCYEGMEEVANLGKEKGCDLVVGIGGGRIIDTAKGVAAKMDCPFIAVPTSIATCSAYTPLSVMYHEDGSFRDTWRYVTEIDAVLVDARVMAAQPGRLIAAGVLDSMAKVPELMHGRSEMIEDKTSIQNFVAYEYARINYDLLKKYGVQAYKDANEHKQTEAIDKVVFLNLTLTGIVSALMRGYHQTALAHRFYDGLRSVFGKEVAGYLHGELVAIGLIMQTDYNDSPDQKAELIQIMKEMDMPCSLADLGISSEDDRIEQMYEYVNIEEFVGRDEASQKKLKQAFLETIK